MPSRITDTISTVEASFMWDLINNAYLGQIMLQFSKKTSPEEAENQVSPAVPWSRAKARLAAICLPTQMKMRVSMNGTYGLLQLWAHASLLDGGSLVQVSVKLMKQVRAQLQTRTNVSNGFVTDGAAQGQLSHYAIEGFTQVEEYKTNIQASLFARAKKSSRLVNSKSHWNFAFTPKLLLLQELLEDLGRVSAEATMKRLANMGGDEYAPVRATLILGALQLPQWV